jgi:hypothetical protein
MVLKACFVKIIMLKIILQIGYISTLQKHFTKAKAELEKEQEALSEALNSLVITY